MKTKLALIALYAIATLTTQKMAAAVPVRVTVEGRVTDLTSHAADFFSVGEFMTGTFMYESSVPPLSPPDNGGNQGRSVYSPFIYQDHGHATIGTYTADLIAQGSFRLGEPWFYISNDLQLDASTIVDQLQASPHADGQDLGIMRPDRFSILLTDSTKSVFDNRNLPTSLPPLSRFDMAQWQLEFRSTNPNNFDYAGYVFGRITAIEMSIVPEPTTLALCIATAFAVPQRRRRR